MSIHEKTKMYSNLILADKRLKTSCKYNDFYKAIVLILVCFNLSTSSALANSTGDSIHILTPKDTIFINFGEYKEKIFTHIITKKQTLYSLAKFYGMSIEDIYYYNAGLKDEVISIGTPVNIPIPNRAIKRYKWSDFDPEKYVPICYRVKSGDNLYRIAKFHFKMSFDTVMVRNQLENTNLKIGQILHLGWMSVEGIPEKYQRSKGNAKDKHNYYLQQRFVRSGNAKKIRQEQGVAYWQREGQQKSGLYALHRQAAINSIIAVTNPMNNRTVYAKVIGKLPNNVYGENITIVVSKTVAKQLGAKDPRFFVKTKFFK